MLFANPGAGARTDLAQAPDAVWLDLLNPGDEERAAAAKAAGFAIQARDEISEIENSSRVSKVGDVLYLNSPVSYRDADGISTMGAVGFALSASRLVTVRFAAMPVFDEFAAAFAKLEKPSAAAAFAGIVEALVDHLADVLEHIGAELDRISRQIFRDRGAARAGSIKKSTRDYRIALSSIGMLGATIDNLRDTLLGLARIVGYVQPVTAVPEDIRGRLGTVRQDIASLNDYDQQLTAKTAFLLDAVMGFINIEQNDVVRVLTVASVVGIPPTFVVGLYGMNFKNMPEYDWVWGYEWGWTVIVVSVVVPLIWFKVKGWL